MQHSNFNNKNINSNKSSSDDQYENEINDNQIEQLQRLPPQSETAEQAVLCGIIKRKETLNVVIDILTEHDFYFPKNQLLYRAAMALYQKNQPVDLMSLRLQLIDWNLFEQAGGAAYLAEIVGSVVIGSNAEFYANTVRNKAILRSLITACADIANQCYISSQDISETLDNATKQVFDIAQRKSGSNFLTIKEVLNSYFDKLTQMRDNPDAFTGIPTGFTQLDNLTNGFQPSDLIIIGARPSMGKTAFAMSLAMKMARHNKSKVAVFSLEMSEEQLLMRMLSMQARVNIAELRRPHKLEDATWLDLQNAANTIQNYDIFIDSSSALTPLELRARARQLKADRGLDIIFIDYLQLMRAARDRNSRELEVAEISRSLKGLAKELNIPVVALSQLNRKLEERSEKRPLLSDIRESGAIEQDADVIMFVHREDVHANHHDINKRAETAEAEIIIAKQRNGPVGSVKLLFHGAYASFENLEANAGPSENGSNGNHIIYN